MARRGDAAEAAATAASEAARVLQARQQETRQQTQSEPSEPQTEPKEEPKRVIKPRNDPRRQAMEEIEARDLKSKGIEPEKEAAKEPAKEEPQAPKTEAAAEVPEAPPAEPEPIKTVRVKVDGEEFDAPQADVDAAGGISSYQRDKAAENRLKKANEALAEARRMQASIAELVQKQQPPQPTLSNEQFIASKMDVIRFGTPEDSAAALREVLDRSNPRVDQDAITQNAVSQMQRSFATQAFQKEFQDVVANPIRLRAAVSLENERTAQLRGPVDWATFYRQIGNEVRSAFAGQSQPTKDTPSKEAAPADSTSTVPDKEARKASIVNLPTAAARAALPEASKPETREDVLTDMRKRRGQPTG